MQRWHRKQSFRQIEDITDIEEIADILEIEKKVVVSGNSRNDIYIAGIKI